MAKVITLSPCDSRVFQKAIDQLETDGVIFLEPGKFQIDNTLRLSSGIKIIGSGQDLTKIELLKHASCHLFSNENQLGGNEYIEISRLSVEGNMEFQPPPPDLKGITFCCGVYLKGVRNISILDVSMFNIRQTGLHFNGCNNIKIRNFKSDIAGWSGVSTTNSSSVDIEAKISNAGLDIRHSGVHLDGGKFARFKGTVSTTTGNGVMLDSKNSSFSHAIVDANVSKCKRGVSLSGFHKHPLHTINISGIFCENENAGVMVSNASDCIIRRAHFIKNKEYGVLFQGRSGGKNSIVSDCYFDRNCEDIKEAHASSDNQFFNNVHTRVCDE